MTWDDLEPITHQWCLHSVAQRVYATCSCGWVADGGVDAYRRWNVHIRQVAAREALAATGKASA